jgi:hypothetical protein
MSNPIRLKFILSPDEYADAIRQNLFRLPSLLIVSAMVVIATLTPMVLLAAGRPTFNVGGSLACALVGATFVVSLYWNGPRSAYRKLNPANRDQEQAFSFTEEGIDIRHATAEAKLDWKSWIKFRENARFFLVYPAQRMFTIIPKRAFASPEEVDAFRELLKRKLGTA